MIQAACGMGAALVGTVFKPEIVHGNSTFIIVGWVLGSAIGIPMGRVLMTAMPQRTALSHAFGALAASLVGIAEYTIQQPTHASVEIGALGLEVMLGSLTVTGSLIAAAKLQELMRGTPIMFKGQQILNLLLFVGMLTCFVLWLTHPTATHYFYGMAGFAFPFRLMLVLPTGPPDNPCCM